MPHFIQRPFTDTRRQLLFAIVVFAFVLPVLPAGNEARAQLADKFLPTWVARRAKILISTYAERPFEKIGWTKDLATSLQMAKESGRPVFLFTHNGRMYTGRC